MLFVLDKIRIKKNLFPFDGVPLPSDNASRPIGHSEAVLCPNYWLNSWLIMELKSFRLIL